MSVFMSVHTLHYTLLTVNHLTPTGKNGSLHQEIILWKKTNILPCKLYYHIHVFLFWMSLLAGHLRMDYIFYIKNDKENKEMLRNVITVRVACIEA